MPIDDTYMNIDNSANNNTTSGNSYLLHRGLWGDSSTRTALITPTEGSFVQREYTFGENLDNRIRHLERMVERLTDKVSDLTIKIKEIAAGKSIDEIDIDDLMSL